MRGNAATVGQWLRGIQLLVIANVVNLCRVSQDIDTVDPSYSDFQGSSHLLLWYPGAVMEQPAEIYPPSQAPPLPLLFSSSDQSPPSTTCLPRLADSSQ